jgi:Fur family ferric uptake transcriptional regulator
MSTAASKSPDGTNRLADPATSPSAELDAQVDQILQTLRRDGGRTTSARRAVISVLLSAPDHLTTDEVTSAVRAELPDVSRSTVYRILDLLARRQIAERIDLGTGRTVHHLTGSSHHHLVCRSCGEVEEVAPSLLDDLTTQLADEYGFLLQHQHVALVGRCRNCARGNRPHRDAAPS